MPLGQILCVLSIQSIQSFHCHHTKNAGTPSLQWEFHGRGGHSFCLQGKKLETRIYISYQPHKDICWLALVPAIYAINICEIYMRLI